MALGIDPKIPPIDITDARFEKEVETNIVFAEVPQEITAAAAFVSALSLKGVVINTPPGRRLRFITHHDVSADDIEFAGACVRDLLRAATTRTSD